MADRERRWTANGPVAQVRPCICLPGKQRGEGKSILDKCWMGRRYCWHFSLAARGSSNGPLTQAAHDLRHCLHQWPPSFPAPWLVMESTSRTVFETQALLYGQGELLSCLGFLCDRLLFVFVFFFVFSPHLNCGTVFAFFPFFFYHSFLLFFSL